MWLPDVPRVSSYHTNIALYAKHFGYPFLSPVIWNLQQYLHNQCAAIMCPSPSTSKTLIDHHFPEEKIRIWHRGVDTQLFSPEKRRKELREQWVGSADKVVLLYVGRVSWEKNLKALSQAYINLQARMQDLHLVITGDGPARTELEAIFANEKVRVTFTGYLEGPFHWEFVNLRRQSCGYIRVQRCLCISLKVRDVRTSCIRSASIWSSRRRVPSRGSLRYHSRRSNRMVSRDRNTRNRSREFREGNVICGF
jgi:glycosyltransferase involved in cell wall biosynthesis